MNRELSPEALQMGSLVRELIEGEGGVDVLRRAVGEPDYRVHVGRLLDRLGVWDIDPDESAVELEAAAEVCRIAGSFALPYPVAERLAAESRDGMIVLVPERDKAIVSHPDLGFEITALTLRAQLCTLTMASPPMLLGSPLAPFGCEVSVSTSSERDPDSAARVIALQSWWLLGLLQTVFADTLRYAQEREQFGRSLVEFQAVAFQLADMSLEVEGLSELARYTVWSLSQPGQSEGALIDALGLRAAAQRASDVVLRGGHQLHGAMGFTNEVDVSWLSKASQAVRRLPDDRGRTLGHLTALVESRGFPHLG